MPLAVNQLMNDAKTLQLDEMLELNKFLVERIKYERNAKAQKMKRQLFIGTRVQFNDGRGNVVEGSIGKIMRKYAQVNTSVGNWRVPMNALTKV